MDRKDPGLLCSSQSTCNVHAVWEVLFWSPNDRSDQAEISRHQLESEGVGTEQAVGPDAAQPIGGGMSI